ncbi:hypothetical protein F4553_000174 [Allocatelliglobosispora scoriae]|uniref:Beta-monoglucosyldiacylglycerol synthase n=1 Tax=Allocatelliglobosispora scoriae TaxID=643052 RepID=A0A841BGN6_9ACTN|nr:glycosyltransferase [Allocatelliglobosispora scoriae]MBB5866795.1 hypothetical protein [Allocatelliglobosispora scoriae]
MAVLDVCAAALATTALANLGAAALLWRRSRVGGPLRHEREVIAGIAAASALGGWAVTGESVTAALAVAAIGALSLAFGRSHPAGRWASAAAAQLHVLFAAFWIVFAATVDAGPVVAVLAVAWAAAGAVTLPSRLIDGHLHREVLCRDGWTRPKRLDPAAVRGGGRLISVHVPTYAEPPEVVCATLDALARQVYRDFEVIVIDNNTVDERLWRPVEQHCRRLGRRFTFLHVAPLTGAKAGALNHALRHTDLDAELIAVVDADYQASPHFLSSLAGYFDDPAIDFVQTRHDYRDWAGNPYLRACYWEYRIMYATYLVSRNEQHTALTTGTMCLLRRSALDGVGGWAQWCPTEDSELAIRLHAAGHHGLYLDESLGRGLIPPTFDGYRAQRHRWIRGPVQELRRHWRLYLPARWAAPSSLRPVQKLLLANHGLRSVVTGLSATTVWLVAAVVLAAAWLRPAAAVPIAALLALVAGRASMEWIGMLAHRHATGCSATDAAQAALARAALSRVECSAGLSGWLGRSRPWGRTAKFGARPRGLRSLDAVRTELAEGVGFGVILLIGVLTWSGSGLLAVALLAVAERSASCLAAPLLALRADGTLRPARTGGPRHRATGLPRQRPPGRRLPDRPRRR